MLLAPGVAHPHHLGELRAPRHRLQAQAVQALGREIPHPAHFRVAVAVAAHPEVCEALSWGKRVVGVRIDLGGASRALVEDLLRAAYDSKAPKRS